MGCRRGKGSVECSAAAEHKCPPPGLRPPSPAASHAGEGKELGMGGMPEGGSVVAEGKSPPPGLRAPSPAASHAGEGKELGMAGGAEG